MKYKLLLSFVLVCNLSFSQSFCTDGLANGYPCSNTHLLSHISGSDLNGGSPANLNDIWGWTDSASNREFALVGLNTGTAFVEITNPLEPVIIGKLPTHTTNSSWRDIKVYEDHAFIGSEAGGHGIQVFDLSQLLTAPSGYQTFVNTAHYAGVGDSHNIVINESSGYAYAVGANFSGGLHAINVSNPTSPVIAGGFSDDGYTHDAQVVNYIGPDPDHQSKEIAFACNTNTLTIVDVTDKSDMNTISVTGYSGQSYTHQGWLTEDHKYFLMGDELDEAQTGVKTTTFIWDVQDLDNPQMIGTHVATTDAIDHNQYVNGQWTYQANYRAGLRVLDISDVANANLQEVAFFDTYIANDNANFNGLWSNYPYFESNNVVLSDIGSGLFVVRPVMTEIALASSPCPGQDISYSLKVERGLNGPISIAVNDLPAGVTYSLSNSSPIAGEQLTLTLSNIDQASAGSSLFKIVFSDDIINHEEDVQLQIAPSLPLPTGLNSNFIPGFVELSWDPIPNTIACKIRGKEVGTSVFQNTPIFYGNDLESYNVSMSFLQANTTYEWQVICGCSVTPIVASPWSNFAQFTTTAMVENDGDISASNWSTEKNSFIIHPNPAKDEVMITSKNGDHLNTIEIINSFGKVIQFYNQIEDHTFRINIEHFTRGIYFVRLSENGNAFTQKLIVN